MALFEQLLRTLSIKIWLWMGIVYHWSFFASINPVAHIFGVLFVLRD
ncbi:DUF6064 family protein [Methanosarcina sp. UBA289]